MATLALGFDRLRCPHAMHTMAGSTMRSAHPGLRQHQLAMSAGAILLLDRGTAFPCVTPSAERGHLVRSGNAIRFSMSLRVAVLDTLSMTGVAIQPLLGMGMRPEVLNGFTVTHFAELAGFLIRKEASAEQQNR